MALIGPKPGHGQTHPRGPGHEAAPLPPGAQGGPTVLCTICGRRPGTIRESKILSVRDLCPPCHRAALLAFLRPRPTAPLLRNGQRCPSHPGPPVVLAQPRQHAQLAGLGYTAEEIAAAGTLIRCAVPTCPWWTWEGLAWNPDLLPVPAAC